MGVEGLDKEAYFDGSGSGLEPVLFFTTRGAGSGSGLEPELCLATRGVGSGRGLEPELCFVTRGGSVGSGRGRGDFDRGGL